jgi:hypothetical protein
VEKINSKARVPRTEPRKKEDVLVGRNFDILTAFSSRD